MWTWKNVLEPELWWNLSEARDILQLEPTVESRRRAGVLCLGPVYQPSSGKSRLYHTLSLSFSSKQFSYFQAPKNTNLKANWAGEPVEFGAHVTYSCNSDEKHFEADFKQTVWDGAECLPGGDWELTGAWPMCSESKVVGPKYRGLYICLIRCQLLIKSHGSAWS